jgi:hypothetical protein
MSSKFATSVLFRNFRSDEATGSWDTREEGRNIKIALLFVSFGIEMILKLFQFPERRDLRDNFDLVDSAIQKMIIFCIYSATGKRFGL